MTDFYLAERVMQLRVEEEHRRATSRRLQKLVGTGRTSWLARQRCSILSRFGEVLVWCGQRLLRLVLQPPPGIQGSEGRQA